MCEILVLGKKNFSDEELKMPENRNLIYDENYYIEEVFTTITNQNTGRSIKRHTEHYHKIADFITINKKSIEAKIAKKMKKEKNNLFDGYFKLFDDID